MAARSQRNNSVLLAVPVSSRPTEGGGGIAELAMESSAEGGVIGMIVGAGVLALSAAASRVRRFRERDKAIGRREVNDRVAVVFYPDRVDLHSRSRLPRRIGELHCSFPLDEVSRPDYEILEIAGTTWTISPFYTSSLRKALKDAGISLR